MANITITINDAKLADVRDVLNIRWGGDPGFTNPQKVAFLKDRIARFIKDEYAIAKAEAAVVVDVEQVRQAAFTSAQTVDIT